VVAVDEHDRGHEAGGCAEERLRRPAHQRDPPRDALAAGVLAGRRQRLGVDVQRHQRHRVPASRSASAMATVERPWNVPISSIGPTAVRELVELEHVVGQEPAVDVAHGLERGELSGRLANASWGITRVSFTTRPSLFLRMDHHRCTTDLQ
jgi:hypothetical protein